MAPTPRRNSSRTAASSSPYSSQNLSTDTPANAKKRKSSAGASPQQKKQKAQAEPEQKTLEETLQNGHDHDSSEQNKSGIEMGDGGVLDADMKAVTENTVHSDKPDGDNKQDKEDETIKDTKPDDKKTDNEPKTTVDPADGAIKESSQREREMPSNVLEKGILYFFSRARVGLEQPSSVEEIARSYLVLRPLPPSAELTVGPIEDLKNNRLLALPKKVLPKSQTDRFMTFVEMAGATIDQLKEGFMAGSTYETQTLGTRASPPVTPLAEGVYAITTTGRESHLAYMLTIPSSLGEVQKAVGLAEKGSFVLSTKNPETKGPANTQLEEPASFSKEITEAFGSRRWMPTEPKHLDFKGCQLLLIGEAQGDVDKATQAEGDDKQTDGKKSAEEEMQLLEDEDLDRVQGLKGDDSIFEDLGMSKNEYPQVQTTW